MTENKIEFSSVIELKNSYDVGMLLSALALVRRYGDLQLIDWAYDFRERLIGPKPNPFEDSEDE